MNLKDVESLYFTAGALESQGRDFLRAAEIVYAMADKWSEESAKTEPAKPAAREVE